jgi:hypothetical protein
MMSGGTCVQQWCSSVGWVDLGDDLYKISIGISQQGIPIVVAGVVWRLHYEYTGSDEITECRVDIIRPNHDDHGWTARSGLDAMHPLGSFDAAKTDCEPVQCKLNVIGNTVNRSAKGLSEPEEIAVEMKPSFDVAAVEIDETSSKGARQWK